MKIKKYFSVVITIAVIFAGFIATSASANEERVISVAEARDFVSGAHVGGASTLVRSKDTIHMTFSTQGLESGAVYTAWWVIFNRPDQCSGGMCGSDDLADNRVATQASLMWASGSIVGQDGIGNFEATLGKEQSSGEIIYGPGLLNTRQAEVHVVLRSHGLPMPGFVYDQLSTLKGGCDINMCGNHQMVMHVAH